MSELDVKREQLAHVREAIRKAEEATSYNLGTRSVTRANLSTLYARESRLAAEVAALEAGGSTRRRVKRAVPLG